MFFVSLQLDHASEMLAPLVCLFGSGCWPPSVFVLALIKYIFALKNWFGLNGPSLLPKPFAALSSPAICWRPSWLPPRPSGWPPLWRLSWPGCGTWPGKRFTYIVEQKTSCFEFWGSFFKGIGPHGKIMKHLTSNTEKNTQRFTGLWDQQLQVDSNHLSTVRASSLASAMAFNGACLWTSKWLPECSMEPWLFTSWSFSLKKKKKKWHNACILDSYDLSNHLLGIFETKITWEHLLTGQLKCFRACCSLGRFGVPWGALLGLRFENFQASSCFFWPKVLFTASSNARSFNSAECSWANTKIMYPNLTHHFVVGMMIIYIYPRRPNLQNSSCAQRNPGYFRKRQKTWGLTRIPRVWFLDPC